MTRCLSCGRIFAGDSCPYCASSSLPSQRHSLKSLEWETDPTIESDAVHRKVMEEKVPTIGIITALPKEYTAMEVLLENPKPIIISGQGAGRRYCLGEIPSLEGSKQFVVLTLAVDMGNNMSALCATLLLEHFPNVRSIIIVGIAGGIPNPEKAEDHVRLGDIVVSKSVIQYDFIKEDKETEYRYQLRPASASLIEKVRYLEAAEIKGDRPWLKFIEKASKKLGILYPFKKNDVLISSTNPKEKILHPKDPKRIEFQPKVFLGPIASANRLLKNPMKRDELRNKFKAKAVEMEGSGIADATWNHEIGYLIIRGICDYCDSNKGDEWQNYAAIAAAAYTRALIESIP